MTLPPAASFALVTVAVAILLHAVAATMRALPVLLSCWPSRFVASGRQF